MSLYHRNPETGKGDAPRTNTADPEYQKNFDRIFGGEDRDRGPLKPGKNYYITQADGTCIVIHESELKDKSSICAHDSTNIVSEASGVNPSQIAEAQATFGDDVSFLPDGKIVYKDRQTKLRILKQRGFVDNDEVRG